MKTLSHNDAMALTLADAADQVSTSHEPMIVTVPGGSVVKITPITPPKPAFFYKGRGVYTREQLEAMTGDELLAIGWIYPDESKWVDEINASQSQVNHGS